MEIVAGYQLLELLLPLVLYSLIVQQPQEQRQLNAKLGDLLAYRTAQLASLNPLALHIQHRLLAVMLELMVLASGWHLLEHQQQEPADYNYALMPLPTRVLIQDVLHSQLQLPAQLLEQLAFPNQHVPHTQSKQGVFREQTVFASGLQLQQLLQIQLLPQQHQSADLNNALIPF